MRKPWPGSGGAEARLAQAEATLAKLIEGARSEEIRRAEAALAEAEARYRMALEGARSQEIAGARAELQNAQALRDEAQVEFERIRKLYVSAAVSEQARDQAKHGFEAAQARVAAAQERLDLLVAGTREEEIAMALAGLEHARATLDELKTGTRPEDIEFARAAREAAKAELERAQDILDEMEVRAPSDGVVESIDVHPGDLVGPGPIVRFVDPEDLELVVYVTAKRLGFFRVGQQVWFTTDSHGDERFTGRISFIANEGEFTPRNLQTEEERVQQVFGVKVKFGSAEGKLRAGMTATAEL